MRIKTTIKDKNKTDVKNKTKKNKKNKKLYIYIYYSRFSNTQRQNCHTHSGTNTFIPRFLPPESAPNRTIYCFLF